MEMLLKYFRFSTCLAISRRRRHRRQSSLLSITNFLSLEMLVLHTHGQIVKLQHVFMAYN